MILEKHMALKEEAVEIANKYYSHGKYKDFIGSPQKSLFPEIVSLLQKHIEAAAFVGAVSSYAFRQTRPDQILYFDNPTKGAIAKFFTGRGAVYSSSHKNLTVLYEVALRQTVDHSLLTLVSAYVFQCLCQERAPVSAREIIAMGDAASWHAIKYAQGVVDNFPDL